MVGGLIATMLFTLFASRASAQTGCGLCPCDSIAQFNYVPGQFARGIYRVQPSGNYDSTDLLDQRRHVPVFAFEYQSDSGDVEILFGSARKNGISIPLHNWCHGKVWNYSQHTKDYVHEISTSQFGSISRTRYFSVQSGDTLQFFRRWLLFDHQTQKLIWKRWRASDDVSFSVELIDSSGARVDLLDTLRISAWDQSGEPSFFTRYPTAALVTHVVPSGVELGTSVALRCNVFTFNGINEPFTRSDVMKYDPEATISNYLGVWKYMSLHNSAATPSSCNFPATVTAGSITVNQSPSATFHAMTVVTPYGLVLASIELAGATYPLVLSLPSGSVIVALRNASGSILCTKHVYIP